MHKMFFVFVPLLFSLFSFEARTKDVANIFLERHAVLLDASEIELGEPSFVLAEDEQFDYLDYDSRLCIPTLCYLSPPRLLTFASKQTLSHSSIRAPPANLI